MTKVKEKSELVIFTLICYTTVRGIKDFYTE
jgi:hypothetical protein